MFLSRQLIQFFAIAENSSLAEAAEKLNLTPSALSHGIHELECKTGILLIQRTGQKSSLTIAGKNLYQQLLPYYTQMTDISDYLSGKKNNRSSLNIKTDSLCYSPLKDKIVSFCKENPNLTLSIELQDSIDIKNEIINTNTDIVMSSDYTPDNEKVNYIDLPSEKIGIIAHNQILDKYDSLPELIIKERLIKIKSETQKKILNRFLNALKIDLSHCRSIEIPAENDISEFILSAAGYCLLSENKKFIDNFATKDCTFIEIPSEYNVLIKRRVYFKGNHNQTISDFIGKIRE